MLHVGSPGRTLAVRIRAVRPDQRWGSAVELHEFEVASGNAWRNPCKPGPDGRAEGFPLAGTSTLAAGLVPTDGSRFEMVCTSGAQGKCVRLGYFPWRGPQMLAAFNACVRAFRADYAGDGSSHTLDGTRIEVFDRLGINAPVNAPGMRFEAGWSPAGAVCLAHLRVRRAVLAAPAGVEPDPACNETAAVARGAVIFTRSHG